MHVTALLVDPKKNTTFLKASSIVFSKSNSTVLLMNVIFEKMIIPCKTLDEFTDNSTASY